MHYTMRMGCTNPAHGTRLSHIDMHYTASHCPVTTNNAPTTPHARTCEPLSASLSLLRSLLRRLSEFARLDIVPVSVSSSPGC